MDVAGEQPLCVKEFYDERTGKWEFKNWDGCFAAGTPVWIASVAAHPIQARSASECIRAAEQAPSADEPSALSAVSGSASALAVESAAISATAADLLLPIETVPLGSRVSTLSPDGDYDFSLPVPQAATWRRIALTIHRQDGATVEIELLRPAEWVARNGLTVGGLHFTHIDELDVRGFARVTAIDPCPPLAEGDGAVVTGRYLTRGAGKLVRVELEDGSDLVGTAQHPIWSDSRQSWTPLGELLPGEQLRGRSGPLAVLAVVPLPGVADVYNLEIHGQHVYDITAAGVLVHNATPCGPGSPKGLASRIKAGESGSFASLDARRVSGDGLTPHHMPQAALRRTPRAEGGALVMPHSEHVLTRNYGVRGARTAAQEMNLPFRAIFARDIRDVRRIAGKTYNEGLLKLIDYYRTSFPELIQK